MIVSVNNVIRTDRQAWIKHTITFLFRCKMRKEICEIKYISDMYFDNSILSLIVEEIGFLGTEYHAE